MKANPHITIGMPVFNDVLFIEKSIKSILSQTFRDFILIISDDGSTDGSQQICEKYVELDSRVRYIRQPQNLGISRNMQYLLSLAETPYFMWAGDDDLMDETYVEKLHDALEKNSDAVSAFSTCAFINDDGILRNEIVAGNRYEASSIVDHDYHNTNKINRLLYYIRNETDYFGYGLFRTEKISGVKFPVWWKPNKTNPLNNIYPTLAYYLTMGDYIHVYDSKPLFFKRIKSTVNANYATSSRNSAFGEILVFLVRKINLVIFTSAQIYNASNFLIALRVFPALFYRWFIVPSCRQLSSAMKKKQ